jgi:hypothetical protein
MCVITLTSPVWFTLGIGMYCIIAAVWLGEYAMGVTDHNLSKGLWKDTLFIHISLEDKRDESN